MIDDNAIDDDSLRAWYARLGNGMEFIFGGVLLGILSVRWEWQLGGPAWLWPLLGLIPSVLEAIGYWLATSPPPESLAPPPALRARLLTRWFGVALAVAFVADTAGVLLGWWEWDAMMIWVIPIVACHIIIIAVFLSSLAPCIDRPRLVWKTYLALGGLAVGMIGFAACLSWMERLGPPEPSFAAMIAVTVSLLSILLFGISSLVILWRYRKALKSAGEPATA